MMTFARYSWPGRAAPEGAHTCAPSQTLVNGWQFAHSPLEPEGVPPTLAAAHEASWHPAREPGSMVQWECYLAGIADPAGGPAPAHPYVGTNSADYRWTSSATWWFRTTVHAGDLDRDASRAELVFDGVDHDAWVWLDGDLAGEHHGMFGGPVLDVSSWLPNGDAEAVDHEIVVALRPAGAGQGKDVGWGTKGRLVKPETFCRWVNNPDLMTAGIWQPVRLVLTGAYRLERPRVTTTLASDGSARVSVDVEILRADVQADLHWVRRHGGVPPVWDRRFLPPQEAVESGASEAHVPAEVTATLRNAHGDVVAGARTTLDAAPGRVWAHLELEVAEPELWWPNGFGANAPSLHHLELALNGPAQDRLEVRVGMREIAWERADGPRLADHWFDWKARVNGVARSLRGMNWMPSDVLRQDRERVRHLLTLMREAGVQIVRVWGGGLLETEDFYDACDELGLMVCQDFPINTLYDCSEIPLDVWEQQVTWTVERLRNRASLVMWCGGNEFDPYVPENAAVVGVLERTLNDLDGTRPFLRSCSDPGDVHPYLECDSTWYLQMYRDVPSISEWGGHTLPTAALLAEILPREELDRPLTALLSADPEAFEESHPVLRHHWSEFQPDRVPRMLNRARIYDDLAEASFTQAVDAIQLGAAEIYQTIITDFSAGDTRCQLLMPWVYNRPWPSVGMQSVDHSGRPTPGYFAVKRGYRPGAIVLRPAVEALAPGEALRLGIGLTHADDEPEGCARTVSVCVYDESLRALFSDTVHLSAHEDIADLAIELPSTLRAVIVIAADVAEPQNQHVRVIRVAPSLADPKVRAEYRSAPHVTDHFAPGSLRAAVATSRTTVRWTLEDTEADGVLSLTIENCGDVPAAFVQIESADPLWLVLPDDSGFWLPPRSSRCVRLRVRPAADVSAIVTDHPVLPPAITVRGWNL